MEEKQERYRYTDLYDYAVELLGRVAVSREEAAIVAGALIQADLEGVASHGISRLPVYLKRMAEKRINPQPDVRIAQKGPAVLLVDGDNGPGPVVATRAIEAGIEKARQSGIVAVGVRQSNHFGMASLYCRQACEANMAALVMTNSPPGIAPWGGRKAFFGTNPIAFGFPDGTDTPVIIDLSASIVARGKVILAAKKGESIPEGWAIDREGKPTTNAREALEGSVLPMGGAKGYALALAVEVLSGILTGAAYGPHVRSIYAEDNGLANVGHFFILIDVTAFMPLPQFQQGIRQMIGEIKQVPRAAGWEEIRIPGERRVREAHRRRETGIRLPPAVVQELKEVGNRWNVPLPPSGWRDGEEEGGSS
ncbi:MAG: Ldh family oxidoreductase [Bacillaceae bacterium]|nr:Ldh family oxidoreductase [Bacillaceae bacterium]